MTKLEILESSYTPDGRASTKSGLNAYYKNSTGRFYIFSWTDLSVITNNFDVTWDCLDGSSKAPILADDKIVGLTENSLHDYRAKAIFLKKTEVAPVEFTLTILNGALTNKYEFLVTVTPPGGGVSIPKKIWEKNAFGEYQENIKKYKNGDTVGDPTKQCELPIKPGSTVKIESFKKGGNSQKGNWSINTAGIITSPSNNVSVITIIINNGINEGVSKISFNANGITENIYIKIKSTELPISISSPTLPSSNIETPLTMTVNVLSEQTITPLNMNPTDAATFTAPYNIYLSALIKTPLLWNEVAPAGGGSKVPVDVIFAPDFWVQKKAPGAAGFTLIQDATVTIFGDLKITNVQFATEKGEKIVQYGFLSIKMKSEEEGCIFKNIAPIPNEVFNNYLTKLNHPNPILPDETLAPIDDLESDVKGALLNAANTHITPIITMPSPNENKYLYRNIREEEISQYIFAKYGYNKIYLSKEQLINLDNSQDEYHRVMDHEICHAIFPYYFKFHKLLWSVFEYEQSFITPPRAFGKSRTSSGSGHQYFNQEDRFTNNRNGIRPIPK